MVRIIAKNRAVVFADDNRRADFAVVIGNHELIVLISVIIEVFVRQIHFVLLIIQANRIFDDIRSLALVNVLSL